MLGIRRRVWMIIVEVAQEDTKMKGINHSSSTSMYSIGTWLATILHRNSHIPFQNIRQAVPATTKKEIANSGFYHVESNNVHELRTEIRHAHFDAPCSGVFGRYVACWANLVEL